jgi:uncharacterized membrane protein YfcA
MAIESTHILVAVALLFAAFVKGASGMGFPLIATPAVALFIDLRIAIAILLMPNIVMDLAQVLRDGFPAAVLRRFRWFAASTVVGVFVGTAVLVNLPVWVVNIFLGAMVLVFVASNWLHLEFSIAPKWERKLATNAAGPALAIYLYSLKLEKRQFVKSMSTIFIVTKLSQVVAVSGWNLFDASTVRMSIQVTLFSLAGFVIGLKVQDRINQETFKLALLVLLSVIGVTLVGRALTQ